MQQIINTRHELVGLYDNDRKEALLLERYNSPLQWSTIRNALPENATLNPGQYDTAQIEQTAAVNKHNPVKIMVLI